MDDKILCAKKKHEIIKVALIGSLGYISQHLLKAFNDVAKIESILKVDKSDVADAYLDLMNTEIFDYSLLGDVEYVIFTAAISSPDHCAVDFDNCWKINVEGTVNFIKEAINRGCRVLFFSSDAVFGDIPGAIYTEESETRALTAYGRMKKAVEDEFKENSLFKAIRLSYVISTTDRFVSYCLKCIKNKDVADVFHPFYRNVVTISDVVNVVTFLINNWDDYEPTFLNVAGKELVSRVRIADEINRKFEGKLKYVISFPENQFFNNRPRITQMKSIYLQKYGILPDKTFTEKFAKEMEGIKI